MEVVVQILYSINYACSKIELCTQIQKYAVVCVHFPPNVFFQNVVLYNTLDYICTKYHLDHLDPYKGL